MERERGERGESYDTSYSCIFQVLALILEGIIRESIFNRKMSRIKIYVVNVGSYYLFV